MNGKPVEPLSAEERELAALLGRTGPHGEPSPALDAKILSAARAAVTRDAARPTARRRRWPARISRARSRPPPIRLSARTASTSFPTARG